MWTGTSRGDPQVRVQAFTRVRAHRHVCLSPTCTCHVSLERWWRCRGALVGMGDGARNGASGPSTKELQPRRPRGT